MSLSRPELVYAYYGGIVGTTLFMAHHIAFRNQAILAAASHLPPPKPLSNEAQLELKRRTLKIQLLKTAGVIAFLLTPPFLTQTLLPIFTSQRVTDAVFLGIIVIISITCTIFAMRLQHGGVGWEWKNGGYEPTLISLPNAASFKRKFIAASVWISIGVGLSYYGQPASIFGLIGPLLVLVGITPKRYSVKQLLPPSPGVPMRLFLLAIVTWGYLFPEVFRPSPNGTSKVWPSDWVLGLYFPWWFALACSMGFLDHLSVALRCDAVRYPRLELPTAPTVVYADGEPIVPVAFPSYSLRRPLFAAGMVALLLTSFSPMLLIDLFIPNEKDQHLYLFAFGLLAANITVPLSIAFCALCTRRWSSWINYNEMSLQEGDETVEKALNDVERLLDETREPSSA